MQREGSAFSGLGVVMLKELSDHLTSVRMRVLEWLVVLVALAALYGAIQQIKDTTAEDPFLFLRLFTTSRDPLPSFVSFLSFLVPLMAIGLGFDSVNGEHTRRTLSRILSQPIYRDALLFGKFLAGLMTLSISLLALWLLVVGLGLLMIGIPPGAEEIARSFVFLLVTIVYAGVWLALALLFSILFRSAATAALITLGLWLLMTFIWPVPLHKSSCRRIRATWRLGCRRPVRRCLSKSWPGCRPRRCTPRLWWRSSIRPPARSGRSI
jgi:ABC-2 type transport system permease protein